LCEIPGISVRTAQYLIAETGPGAESFASPGKLASWVAICPGQQESAGVTLSNSSAKGNWMMRRTLSQTAWAAVKSKGSEARRRFSGLAPETRNAESHLGCSSLPVASGLESSA
jgi:transposase